MHGRELATARRLTSREVEVSVQASLKSCLGSRLEEQADDDWDLAGYLIAPGADAAALAECRQILKQAMRPCDDALIIAELARLRVSTAPNRREPEEDTLLGIQVRREFLARYPEDAVVEALRHLGESQQFWPTLSEIKLEVEARTKKRRLLKEALDAAAPRGAEAPAIPQLRPGTTEFDSMAWPR